MSNYELAVMMAIAAALLMIFILLVSIRISLEIKKRIQDTGIAYRRGIIFKYLRIYKDHNVREGGKPGALYYSFIISLTLFVLLLFAVIILASS